MSIMMSEHMSRMGVNENWKRLLKDWNLVVPKDEWIVL